MGFKGNERKERRMQVKEKWNIKKRGIYHNTSNCNGHFHIALKV